MYPIMTPFVFPEVAGDEVGTNGYDVIVSVPILFQTLTFSGIVDLEFAVKLVWQHQNR